MVKFSRPELQHVFFYITLRAYDGFDPSLVPVLQSALRDHVNLETDIGQDLVLPQLYGFLYRKAGNLASTFAITDISATGPEPREEREKLACSWNGKFMVDTASDIEVTVST